MGFSRVGFFSGTYLRVVLHVGFKLRGVLVMLKSFTPNYCILNMRNNTEKDKYFLKIHNELKWITVKPNGIVTNNLTGNILGTKDRKGYIGITFTDPITKTVRSARVHRLVYLIHGEFPLDNVRWQINHIDGDKANNSLFNLEPCSGAENVQHAVKLGLGKVTRSFTNAEVLYCRNAYANKQTYPTSLSILAKICRTTKGNIYSLLIGLSYRHIGGPRLAIKLSTEEKRKAIKARTYYKLGYSKASIARTLNTTEYFVSKLLLSLGLE